MNPGTDSPAFLESNARETSTRRPFWQEVIALPLHFLLGTIGGTLLFMLLAGILGVACSSIGFPVPEVGFLYNPLLWSGAVVLGALVNRELRHRSACLVGIVGALLLLAIMRSDISLYERSDYYRNLTDGHYWRYEFQQLFSPENRTCADSECFGKLLFALPFLASVAYSIGAWLGLRFGDQIHTSKNRPDQSKGTEPGATDLKPNC